MIDVVIEGPLSGASLECEAVLRALPEWFGIEASIMAYVREVEHLPTFLASANGQVIGFLSLKQHFPESAEIYVMGVRQHMHRSGAGRSLVQAAIQYLRGEGVEYLQVKTLSPARPDPGYEKTRAFYLAMGFRPLEEFKEMWDPQNPCLLLVQRL